MSDTKLIDVHVALQQISSALDRFITLDEYDAINKYYPMGVPEDSVPEIIQALEKQHGTEGNVA